MIKNYYLSLLLFCCTISFGYGQTDDFTDGNFTANPVWSGDAVNFSILTNGTLPNGSAATDGSFLGSNASTGSIAITTPSTEVSEWEFSLGSPSFNPSSSNSFGVVLMSNTAVTGNITGSSWNGYYLKIGVDASADRIELWRKNGPLFGTKVGDFPSSPSVATGALRNGLNIRVTRSAVGEFELFYSTGFTYAATPTTSAGTLTNNDITTSSFFGIYSKFTNMSTSRRVYIDNIVLGGIVSTDTSLEFATTASSLAEGGAFIDVCVEITNPSATTATTVDIALNGSSTATNGSDYDDGAGMPAAIAFPQTLTFPIGSSANQCLTIFISNDDILIEGNETVVLDLINPAGGDSAALGTDIQHILTITDNDVAPIADVVITEIMYNSAGTDDEWIEICNVSGSPQVLNDYTVRYNGSVLFTLPSTGVIIADGACITVSLGSNGDGTYNNGNGTLGNCPFTPDYGIGASTNNTNNIGNTSGTISIVASDGSTVIDTVDYDDGDGADGDGPSLHVPDASMDNSNTGSNWQEVINGGSPGTNALISPCTPIGPEINVEGATGFFPDIADGDVTPNTFDGTDFGDSFIGFPLANSFRIENFGGTTDLTITSVFVLSGDIGDFSISTLPATPIAALSASNFDIEFNPTAVGARTAVIQILNNDAGESPYTFTVTGNGLCFASAITALPSSGPVGTIVSVTGTDLATATASFNGLPAIVNNISATLMEVTIPDGATTGNLEITDSIGCPGFTPFTIIDSQITSCEGSGGVTPTDLFISEITDATLGGLTYIELFNGTGAGINIDTYSIEVIANGNATPSGFNIFDLENVVIADGDTYIIAIGRSNPIDASNYCTSVTGGSGELTTSTNAQFINGGVNKKDSQHDVIRLVNSGTTVDEFGVYLDNDWMDSTIITGDRGFNFRRLNTATILPDPTFTLAELGNWTVIDWVGSGTISCSGNDYSDIGLFDFSVGSPPLVASILTATTACNETTITVSASEGFGGGNASQYYWSYYNPAQSGLGWQTITNGGIYTTNVNSPDLIISDAENIQDYQFYCEVREDDATCYSASDAIKITVSTTTWMSGAWNWNDGTLIGTAPTLSTNVILSANYDTAGGGIQTSFSACSLVVNSTFNLNIQNGTFIEVENDITANGDITVFPQGSVVQINDLAMVTAAGTITVQKETTVLNSPVEYTYWSSSVVGETVENVLSATPVTRRYSFSGLNFVDILAEINNTGVYNPGQDDIDDNANAWQLASGTLLPGFGYAAMPSPFGPFPAAQQITFVGAFNNGVIQPTIYNNSGGVYNDWNFIGNPYPSAISTVDFFNVNTGIVDTIYLWNQATAADFNAIGNEGANFSSADYAVISASGINTAGGDLSSIPGDFVPSGQGFFIEALSGTSVTFNNSMRETGNNNQFFRNANTTDELTSSRQVLWLNLNSDNGVAKQIAVAHLDGASNAYDGSFYDVKENLSTGNAALIYSVIADNNTNKFVIQGRNLNSLDEGEIIPIGFKTSITVPTLYKISIAQFEGNFYTERNIYIKDNILGILHNLKESDYTFTSETGEFNNRFEIVFRADALSIDDQTLNSNDLTITELSNGEVQFAIGKNHNITNVEILDVIGRQIYNLKGHSSTERFNLSRLSKAAYIAKVTLSNGQVISKKAIKQQ